MYEWSGRRVNGGGRERAAAQAHRPPPTRWIASRSSPQAPYKHLLRVFAVFPLIRQHLPLYSVLSGPPSDSPAVGRAVRGPRLVLWQQEASTSRSDQYGLFYNELVRAATRIRRGVDRLACPRWVFALNLWPGDLTCRKHWCNTCKSRFHHIIWTSACSISVSKPNAACFWGP